MIPGTNGHTKDNNSAEELFRSPYTHPIICGLLNIGNTCYFNSGVQCLCTCSPLVAALELMTPNETTSTDTKVSAEITSTSLHSPSPSLWSRLLAQKRVAYTHYRVWAELQNLIHDMKVTDELCLNPVYLIDAVANAHPQFEGLFQQDCAEMIHQVLSSMDDCTRVDWYPEEIDTDSHPISSSANRLLAVYRLMIQINEENGKKHFKQQERNAALHPDKPLVVSPFIPPRLFSSPLCDPFRGYLLNSVRCHKCGESSRVIHEYTSLSLDLPSMRQRARYGALYPEFVLKMEKRFNTNRDVGESASMKGWRPLYNISRFRKRFNLLDATASMNNGCSPYTVAVVIINFSRWIASRMIGFLYRLIGMSSNSQGLVGTVFSWISWFSNSDPEDDDFDDSVYNSKTGKVWDESVVTYPLTLEECLGIHFLPETLRGQNRYLCESCGERSTATKHQMLLSLPELLTIQLNRFDFHGRWTTKKYDAVNFPVPEYPLSPSNVYDNSKDSTLKNTALNSFKDPRTIQELEEEYLSLANYMVDGKCLLPNDISSKVTTEEGSAAGESCNNEDNIDNASNVNGRQKQTTDNITSIDNSVRQNVNENDSRACHFPVIPPAQRTTYGLISVVNHRGSGTGGHYTSYCLKGTEAPLDVSDNDNSDTVLPQRNRWILFDDQRVGVFSASQVSNTEGYLLVFQKQDVCSLDIARGNDHIAVSGIGDTFTTNYSEAIAAEAAARKRAQEILIHSPLSRSYSMNNQPSSSYNNDDNNNNTSNDNNNKIGNVNENYDKNVTRIPRAWLVAVATSLEPGPLPPPRPSSNSRLCPNYEDDWYYVEVNGNSAGLTMEDYLMFRRVFGGR